MSDDPNQVCPHCRQVRMGSVNPNQPDVCINCGQTIAQDELGNFKTETYKPPDPEYVICPACNALQPAAGLETCVKCAMTPADAKKHAAKLRGEATPTATADTPRRKSRASS